MFPHFEFLGKTISLYSVCAIIGMLIAGYAFCTMIRKRNMDNTDTVIVLVIGAAGALIGSHALYALTNIEKFRLYGTVTSFSQFIDVTQYLFGGAVFYGGLIGGIAAAAIAVHVMKLNKTLYFDIAAFIVPFFHGFARVGCFLGGCCYGIESDFGFTAHGNDWVPAVNDVSRFPVQLLESLCCFAIAFIIWQLYRNKKLTGRLFPVYLLSYAAVRFSDEYLRGDAIRGFVGPFSTSQFISMLVAALAVAFLLIARNRKTEREA